MDDENMAQVMEETTLTKIRLKLNEQKVKLWEPPYYNKETRQPQEPQLHELAVVLKADMDLPLPHIFQGVQMLQQNAIDKISARDRFKEAGILNLRLRCARGLKSKEKTVEIPAASLGSDLVAKVGELVGQKPDHLKLISGGRIIQADSSLADQGVKTSGVIMAVIISDRESMEIVAEQRRILEQTKQDAARLGERDANSDDYFLQVADQSGRSLDLPTSERKALIIAMSLHEKGRAALLKEDYSAALILLLEAESEFSSCRSELVSSVDNFAILGLDIAWCYLRLHTVSELPNAEARLEACENKFNESYGKNLERLAFIKGATGKEAALLMRLHLLQGIVAFHLGREKEARLLLQKTQIEAQLLEVKEESLLHLHSLGYSIPEARLGLRASQGDIQGAVDQIERRRQERKEIRRKEEEDREREKLRNKLGKCADGSWVNVGYYKTLLGMGFTAKVAAAALKQADNSLNTAVQLLQEEPELVQLAVQEAKEKVSEEDVVRLVSLGYTRKASEASLRSEGSVEAAADLLLANNGVIEVDSKREKKKWKEDKEAFNRIKEDIAEGEEDHLDMDLRIEMDFLEKYLKLLKK